MVVNKSKTLLIRRTQKKNMSLIKINYNTRATHSYNIVIFICDIFFFCICHSGSFPIVHGSLNIGIKDIFECFMMVLNYRAAVLKARSPKGGVL